MFWCIYVKLEHIIFFANGICFQFSYKIHKVITRECVVICIDWWWWVKCVSVKNLGCDDELWNLVMSFSHTVNHCDTCVQFCNPCFDGLKSHPNKWIKYILSSNVVSLFRLGHARSCWCDVISVLCSKHEQQWKGVYTGFLNEHSLCIRCRHLMHQLWCVYGSNVWYKLSNDLVIRNWNWQYAHQQFSRLHTQEIALLSLALFLDLKYFS